jgi:ATP-dependent DNA ligase
VKYLLKCDDPRRIGRHEARDRTIAANWFLDAGPRDQSPFHRAHALAAHREPASGRVVGIRTVKLNGFRAEAIKSSGRVHLRSRNDKDFNARYPVIVQALAAMPDETVIDGEIVALESGRPSFNALQNLGYRTAAVFYYVFDMMILAGKDVMHEPLTVRRELLQGRLLAKLGEPIRESPELDASVPELICSVKAQGLEGLVAKRCDSRYEPSQRSGAWQKMRVNQGQDFVIAGYTPTPKNFDAVVFGYYDGGKLMYAGRTRNGFTPSLRDQLFKRFKALAAEKSPFVNLPEARGGRWGEGLTAEKMKECRWLLCRMRHSSHNVECRTMPYAFWERDFGCNPLPIPRV